MSGFVFLQSIAVDDLNMDDMRARAARGDAPAMFVVTCHLFATNEDAEGMRLLMRTAELGYGMAIHALGVCYEFGNGVEKSSKTARQLYRRAAELGEPIAMVRLG